MNNNVVKSSKSFIRMAGLLAVLSTAFQPGAVAEENPKTNTSDYIAGEIVVSSTRTDEKLKNIPRKVEVISSKEIEAINPSSATELLQKTAGVDVVSYGGVSSGVSMRGFVPNYGSYLKPQYVIYLLDGRPLGTYNLGLVDMNMIERVEVIKGPSSALYGSKGMGGTINFMTKKSQGLIKGTASLGYGSFETFEGSATVGGSISDRFDFDLGFRYFNQGEDYKIGKNTLISNPDQEILEREIDTMHNSTYSTNSGMMRVGYRLNDNFRVNLRSAFFNAPSVHTPGSVWGYSGNGIKDVYRKTADISLTGTAGSHSIKFMPYWSKDEMKYLKQTGTTPNKIYPYYLGDFEEYGFQLQDVIALGNHRITAGLDDNNQTYKNRKYSAPDVAARPYSADSRNSNFGLFTQAAFSFFDNRLIVTPGGRFDATTFGLLDTPLVPNVNTKEEHDRFFSPSLAFQYSFVPEFKVHSNIGRAFVAPVGLQKAGEYVNSYGTTVRRNPDLKPETSRTWDVGLSWSGSKRGIRADVTYFYSRFEDFITTENRTDGSLTYQTYVNAASAKLRGLEFELSYDFGALADYRYLLRCFASYTHQLENDVTKNGLTSSMKYVRDSVVAIWVPVMKTTGFVRMDCCRMSQS